MKSKYLMIGAAVCAALFLFSGIMLCRQYADEQQSAEAFEQIAALVETEPAPADTPPETEPLPELTAFEKYRAVQEQNSDFLGWLSILGTNIDYPVMQTVDEPNFYLKHGFDKKYADCGCPYVQENCDVQKPSDNLVIYGHHMNNGTMFADLCNYTDYSYFSEHPTVVLETKDGVFAYSVFSVMKVKSDDDWYRFTTVGTEKSYEKKISYAKEKSIYDTEITPVYGQQILTLSTCYGYNQDNRILVLAVRN